MFFFSYLTLREKNLEIITRSECDSLGDFSRMRKRMPRVGRDISPSEIWELLEIMKKNATIVGESEAQTWREWNGTDAK